MKRRSWVTSAVLVAMFAVATSVRGQASDEIDLARPATSNPCEEPVLRPKCQAVAQALALLQDAGFDRRESFVGVTQGDGQVEAWRLIGYRAFANDRYQWCSWLSSCKREMHYSSARRAEKTAEEVIKLGYVTDAAPVAFVHRPKGGTALTPVMLTWSEADLVYAISEEVARQALRGPDDPFVRSYAASVAKAILTRWSAQLPAEDRLAIMQREVDRAALMRDLWDIEQQVRALPDVMLSASGKRARQEELLEALRRKIAASPADVTGGRLQLTRLVAAQLNIAHLDALPYMAPYVSAFEAMLQESGGDLRAFNGRVAQLAQASKAERMALLQTMRLAVRN